MAAIRTTLLLLGVTLQGTCASTNNAVRDLCRVGQRVMYHPYPGDSSRYIQCNKFGRSFIRHCNSGHAWSQVLRTCVTGSIITDLAWNDRDDRQPAKTETYLAHDKRVARPYMYQVSVAPPQASVAPHQPKYQHALKKNQYMNLRYAISPLTYMYKLSTNPAYGYDTHSYSRGVKPADAKSAGKQFTYGSGTQNPYKYYYSYTKPASGPAVKRFTSTAHGRGNPGSSGTGSYSPSTQGISKGTFTSGRSYSFGSSPGYARRAARGKGHGASYTFGSKDGPHSIHNRALPGRNEYGAAYSQGETSSTSNGNTAYSGTARNNAYVNSYAFGSKQGQTQSRFSRGNTYDTSYSDSSNTYSKSRPYDKFQSIAYGDAQGNARSTSYPVGSGSSGAAQRSVYGTSFGNSQNNAQSGSKARSSYGGTNNDEYVSFSFGVAQASPQSMPNSYYYSSAYKDAPSKHASVSHGTQYGTQYGTSNAYGQLASYYRHKGKSARIHTPRKSQPRHTPSQSTTTTQCSEGTVRYLPDPHNEKHYFECISEYKMVTRVCGGASVWVQPLRMCVDVNDRVTTNVPTTNPCAGTDAQYKAYPMDPTKYIECRAWYSVLVWTCRAGQIWVQEQQKCVETKKLQPAKPVDDYHPQPHHQHTHPTAPPPQARPQVTVPRPAADGSNPCDNTTFHFAYPGDVRKFIQCDEFGHAFIRPCASSSVWNDQIKTCAKNLGVEPKTIRAVQINSNSYEYDFSNAQPLDIRDYQDYDIDSTFGTAQYAYPHSGAKTYIYNNVESSYTSTDKEKNCDDGDLWVPSLRICASMKDAQLESDYCHSGDYYFPDYHVCASIRYSDIEGKSLPNKDSYTYTNYDSYVTDYDKSTLNNGAKESDGFISGNHCAADYMSYNGPNPCGLNDTYYYEFPDDTNCFIQCDQLNTMYVMSCAIGSMWNQDAVQCVQNNEGDYDLTDLDTAEDYSSSDDHGNSKLAARSSNMGTQFSADYPQSESRSVCDGRPGTSYKRHSGNAHRFIMCVNNVAYPMMCPQANLWRQDIQTCFWPQKHN